ncbi:MAG: SMC-Scp complex subunit ScpB [candidate division WOR-3 bacterium]|nr:SMC-Scp complex subunit ScpB [candidate division WOR-3 bacterium]MCX7837441.1 SMC-Scp complex subunit ScpB [candidate division WOR-3 bacterium]MDW8114123.1 SMC-Scp complex subunit ScpB [candidate division WOR-3 bacterium]
MNNFYPLQLKEEFERLSNNLKFNGFKKIIEAILFVSNEPISEKRLKDFLGISEKDIEEIISFLNEEYEQTERSFRIRKIAQGYQLFTLPEYSDYLNKFYQEKKKKKLSPAALEVLAIIAYHQPITKQEIEKIRGVDSTYILNILLEKKLIKIEGRAKRPGAPFLYSLTKEFLKYFGLNSFEDLPKKEEIESFLTLHEGYGRDKASSES